MGTQDGSRNRATRRGDYFHYNWRTAFTHLFQPLRIRGCTLKNRIMSSGQDTTLPVDGTVNAALVAYQEARARGEAVVIDKVDTLVLCTGHTPVDELSDALESLNVEVRVIGEAASPRTAEEAIYEGLTVAAEI
jgi:hypothetical protein